MQPLAVHRARRAPWRVVVAICALLLAGAALTLLSEGSSASGNAANLNGPAPFELPGYRFTGEIDLSPYGTDERPPFPSGLAFGADGTVFVGDAATMRVLALNQDGALKFDVVIGDPQDPAVLADLYERLDQDWSRVAFAFSDRLTLANAPDGTLYANAARHRVYELTPDGQIAATWKPLVNFEANLVTAGFIAADNAGNVYYSERQNCSIGVLRADGSAGALVAIDEMCSTEFEDITAFGDHIYAAAPTNSDDQGIIVPVFDLSGQTLEPITVRGEPNSSTNGLLLPTRIAGDSDGNLLVVTFTLVPGEGQGPLTHVQLLTISLDGEVLAMADMPTTKGWVDIAVAPDGTLGILYRDGTSILLFEPVA